VQLVQALKQQHGDTSCLLLQEQQPLATGLEVKLLRRVLT
jgi:hypothetical protein